MSGTRGATAAEVVAARSLTDVLDGLDTACVFTHSITSLWPETGVARTLPGYDRYDERAVLLARPRDVVCVTTEIDRGYLTFLDGLGIGPARERLVVVGGDPAATLPERLAADSAALARVAALLRHERRVALFPYVVTAREHALRVALEQALGRSVTLLGGAPDLVARANQKHWVQGEAEALGIPVAPGEILTPAPGGRVEAPVLAAAVARHVAETGRVIVRATYSTSGSGVLVVDRTPMDRDGPAPDDLERFAERHGEAPCLVQVMYEVETSPNVQLFVRPGGGVVCVGVTDQRLDPALRFAGSVHPSMARTLPAMLESAVVLARRLGVLGYRGLLGLDFIEYVDPRHGELRHALAEVNARVNAATYACAIRERLDTVATRARRPPVSAVRSAVVASRARSFDALRDALGPRVFDPATGRGVVPYNVGCLNEGECDLAVLGESREEVESLHDTIRDAV
jgi:hypothetical protein